MTARRRQSVATALLLSLAASLAAQAKPAAPEAGDAEGRAAAMRGLVDQARKKLAAIGYTVRDTIACEERTKKEARDDLDEQQELLMPPNCYAAQFALLRAFGVRVGRDADSLRKTTVTSLAQKFSAYYDVRRKSFVMLDTDTRQLAESLAGSQLPLVVHELVHAHQDERDGGIAKFVDAATTTLDRAMAARCVNEGEAEVAAFLALQGAAAAERLPELRAANKLDGMLAGEITGMVYAVGREFGIARHAAGGLDAVRAVWQAPPASSEQAMHPAKYGQDAPTAATLPEFEGCKPATATTVGEMLVFHLLRQIGVARDEAGLAAAGWDGDLLTVYDTADGEGVAVVWRTLWDRPEDAADFAARIAGRKNAAVVADGRVVDFVAAPQELRDRIVATLAQHRDQPPEVAADVASTAAAEAELRAGADRSAVEGATWRLDDVGLAIPVPDGWELKEFNGMKVLFDVKSAKSGFARNVNVLTMPRGDATSVADLLAANRAQLEQMKLTVVEMAVAKRGETEVLCGDYHGRIGRNPAVHALMLIYLRGDQQVVITATGAESAWTTDEPVLRKLMDELTIAPE